MPSLTDQLQQTIRRAFHGDAPEQPSQLTSRSGMNSHHDTRTAADHDPKPNRNDQSDDSAPKKADASGRQSGQQKDLAQSKPGTRGTQPQAGANVPLNFQGSSPAAGEGSSPRGLLDPNAPAAVGGQGEPKRFRLAITSFLHPVPQQAERPSRASGRAGATASSGSGVALNERQVADDAVRKAEIPPEYEDLVRRVYSRTEP